MLESAPLDVEDTSPSRRKTHLPNVAGFLQKLPLPVKLKANYEIEQANFERMHRSLKRQMDPATFPDDASSIASFITIDSAEMHTLNDPLVFATVKDVVPFYILQELSTEEEGSGVGATGCDSVALGCPQEGGESLTGPLGIAITPLPLSTPQSQDLILEAHGQGEGNSIAGNPNV
ncbi:hypothetical protein P691DRAFT_805273 [Macrolepiota fuliginosa MF-IS2]|uniref:Uncharacterized protein n=1 Tax=Macrolepiota fuliginosa MF-IS2 TaxID=1400762 RepID=A0A9P5X8N0_9AGAR|nr:hypothetical protein P691DRAFT_805273 [Macrolepiota fuliginosa MF-IS2]